MSHEPTAADSIPHEPSHPAPRLQAEGFKSTSGRDIFFTAVQSTRMPMVVADPRLPDVPIVFVNEAFLRMTGYDESEVVGRNCRFLQGPETDRDSVRLIREAVQADQEITIELLNYRKDGSTFWNALFMTPIRNAEGEVVYFFSSQLDITRRRDAEVALQHAQKMEALGQLTGGIAHDFNNLLQVIMGNVDLARILTRSAEPHAALEKALGSIKEAARKSAVLTQQLLAFARKQQLQGRVINLSDYIDRHADDARRALGDGVSLRQELSARLWNTRIDPTQAEMALLNLLSNARDAMPHGGHVTLRTANIHADGREAIARGLPRPGRFVMVEVADDGAGIPADVISRVMDPFFTTKPLGEGTGLGLSMVYGFAKQSGGIATLQSVVGQGTQVQMYFPAAHEDAPLDDIAAPPPVAKPDGHERILVVDDRPEVAEMAASVLSTAGYACTVRGNADAALDALGDGTAFNLMLTDLLMPGGMNGVMLAREAQRRHPHLRVLLMTGFADGTPDRWGGEHFQILMKPFSADDLLSQVRQALDQREAPNTSVPRPQA